MQTQEHIVNNIFSKLQDIHISVCGENRMTENDVGLLKSDIFARLERGWLENEIVCLLVLTEEVNPNISEDYALDRMGYITKNVVNRESAEALKQS